LVPLPFQGEDSDILVLDPGLFRCPNKPIQSVRLHLALVLTGQRRLQHGVKAIVATAFTCSQRFLMISAAFLR